MAKKNLNGWRRLFILLSALYAIPVVIIAVITYPDGISTYRSIADNYRIAIAEAEGSDWSSIDLRQRTDTKNNKAAIDYLLAGGQPRYIVDSNASPLDKEEAKRSLDRMREAHPVHTNRLLKDRLLHAPFTLAAWLIPCLIVYALGLSVAWVVRGFRTQEGK